MKASNNNTVISTILLALAVLAVTSATITGSSSSSGNDSAVKTSRDLDQRAIEDAVPMTFTGPIFVGGPSITLTGTAKEVYEQILVKNPNYNAWDWPEYQTNMAGSGLKKDDLPTTVTTAPGISRRALSPLDIVTCFPPGEKVINWPTQCGEGIQYLQKLNGYCGAPAGLGIGLGVGGCARASCSQNCGIFLCNNNAFAISVWCANIAGDVQNIGAECESPSSAAGNEVGPSLKGQIYRNGWPAWNTAVRNEVC